MTSVDPLLVARIGKPHGLHGEVTVQLHTDDPQSRFVVGATFRTLAAAGSGVPRKLTLSSHRVHRGIWLLGFEEIPDRTGAESLRGTLLHVDAEALAASDEDEEGWYEDELVGLVVRDLAGNPLGEVTGLVVGAAQDMLEIRLTDGRSALVPFVEQIVPTVDLDAGQIILDPPGGLLDLES